VIEHPSTRRARAAGVVIPVFSLRGPHDTGSGELLDLIDAVSWLAEWHHGVLQILPINETRPDQASPYDASSAFAIDPAYVSASRVVDVAESSAAQAWLQSEAVIRARRAARESPQRQRAASAALQLRLLEFGLEQFRASASADRRARFAAFCRRSAWWLDDYALFRALKERFEWASWETWPAPLRDRQSDALRDAVAKSQDRIQFAQYMQWLASEQWETVRAAAERCGVWLEGDLPFVCGRDSADVWAHPELFDPTASAGAPPDDFSPTGQAWGLPLYNWEALREQDYRWWRQRAMQARELYHVVRIDHVVGLYRTFAIPARPGGTSGFVPAEETAQRIQGEELMRALLQEAGETMVVAEDLGTVPEWVRTSLTQIGVPGYKVLRWEQRQGAYFDPSTYPVLSIATTGTHDTETLATWWQTLAPAERSAVIAVLGEQLEAGARTGPELAWSAVHPALLRCLYAAPSQLTILPIQDLFAWEDRINTPATVGPQNWVYRLPTPLHRLDADPGLRLQLERVRTMIDASGRWPVAPSGTRSDSSPFSDASPA
jgi:4-alpha-glucanotransferase